MRKPVPAFAPPTTPAAKCHGVMRRKQLITRNELVEATGLSQPTVTRAVAKLIDSGLAHPRPDLTRSQGRGRPTVPLEIIDQGWLHAGIAVATNSTFIGLFDVRGRTIRSIDVDLPIAAMSPDDVIEHLMASLNRLCAGLDGPLTTVGVTFPGHVSAGDVVDAPSIGWHGVELAQRLRYQFSTPVTIAAAVPAILGSELHMMRGADKAMALFADDSIGAAVTADDCVNQLPVTLNEDSILPTAGLLRGTNASTLTELVESTNPADRERLDNRVQQLAELAVSLISEHSPTLTVVAGSAFIDDPQAPSQFARIVRGALGNDVQLRLIPSHREIIRAIAGAVALDPVVQNPLELA